jgi:hypothetical protein
VLAPQPKRDRLVLETPRAARAAGGTLPVSLRARVGRVRLIHSIDRARLPGLINMASR